MDKQTATDILKTAILLERRGKAFYSTVAKQTQSKAVKEIFTTLAEEEDEHIEFLSKQFAHYGKTKSFLKNEFKATPDHADVKRILSEDIKKQISAADYEAAAISAAIEFENRSIEVYATRAEESDDPNEKEMYEMLADWERTHHKLLHKMNEELQEQIWYDNKFWPF